MDFNEENKVIIASMNQEEAKAFLGFLSLEMVRHANAFTEALRFALLLPDQAPFWDSALGRHKEDIQDIRSLTIEVKERFGL